MYVRHPDILQTRDLRNSMSTTSVGLLKKVKEMTVVLSFGDWLHRTVTNTCSVYFCECYTLKVLSEPNLIDWGCQTPLSSAATYGTREPDQ